MAAEVGNTFPVSHFFSTGYVRGSFSTKGWKRESQFHPAAFMFPPPTSLFSPQ
jgi:hypothetical protein